MAKPKGSEGEAEAEAKAKAKIKAEPKAKASRGRAKTTNSKLPDAQISIKQSIKQSIEQSINKCMYGMHSCTLISTLFVYSTYPNNHNINNITSGVQYQATTASVNNLKVFPTLRGLRSLPLHLRVSIHMHASNTYTVIVCFLELLLMRVHTLRSNPKIQKPLTPKHC